MPRSLQGSSPLELQSRLRQRRLSRIPSRKSIRLHCPSCNVTRRETAPVCLTGNIAHRKCKWPCFYTALQAAALTCIRWRWRCRAQGLLRSYQISVGMEPIVPTATSLTWDSSTMTWRTSSLSRGRYIQAPRGLSSGSRRVPLSRCGLLPNHRQGRLPDRYVLVSPYLRYNAPSVRESTPGASASQSWASASVGRIIGLTIANRWGLHAWDDLAVLAFPVPANIEAATNAYSWRLYKNFAGDDDYLAEIHRTLRPMQVLVGDSDELLDATKLKSEFQSQRSDVPVSVIRGMGHSDMVTRPTAILAIVAKVAGFQ